MQQLRLKLSDITVDRTIQMRAELSEETIAEYAAAYKAGAKMPPLTVFNDGKGRWLADGFQRYEGAKKSAQKIIQCNEFRGTRRDAMLFSIGANGTHGARRTNADKRKAVLTLLADPEWLKWSLREMAQRASVTAEFVRQLKLEQVSTVDTSAQSAPSNSADLQESTQCAKPKKKGAKKAENAAKPDEKPDDIVPDETGAEAPVKSTESVELNAACEAHRPTRALADKLHEVIRDWEALGQAAHPFISEQSVTSHLKAAVAEIRMGQPYAVCPCCQGQGTCKEALCHKSGWLNKSTFDNLPRELKIGAVVLK